MHVWAGHEWEGHMWAGRVWAGHVWAGHAWILKLSFSYEWVRHKWACVGEANVGGACTPLK